MCLHIFINKRRSEAIDRLRSRASNCQLAKRVRTASGNYQGSIPTQAYNTYAIIRLNYAYEKVGFMNVKTKRYRDRGFTIVELLVVIVVIGILAAITIVSYSGIASKAIVANLQSDLTNDSKQLRLYNVEHGYYPSSFDTKNCPLAPDIDTRYCLKASNGVELSYIGGAQIFRLTATKNGVSYRITENKTPFSIIPVPITAIGAITGAVQIAQTLSAGTITPADATVTYQWQNAATSGGTYTDIADATASTYVINQSDAGKYLRLVIYGADDYIGTQTSAVTTVVIDPWANWYPGLASTVLAGKHIYKTDTTSASFGATNALITSPQGAAGLDPSYPSDKSLVSPQANPGVSFSAFPAQNACKVIGGRLPNMQQLNAIYAGRASYGNNFNPSHYWSATENTWYETLAHWVHFEAGVNGETYKTMGYRVRCIAD